MSHLRCSTACWPGLLLIVCGVAGCSEPDLVGPTVPVSGRVTIDGAPVPMGNLVLKPDQQKGTKTQFEPVAYINSDGSYTVKTGAKDGAPVGWYKVAIESSEPITDVVATGTMPKSYVPARYNSESTSGITIEVRADAPPGTYDFALTTKPK